MLPFFFFLPSAVSLFFVLIALGRFFPTFFLVFFFYFITRFIFLLLLFFLFFYYETNCSNEAMIFIVCAMLIVGQSISNTTDYISFTTVLFVFFLRYFFHQMPSWPRSFLLLSSIRLRDSRVLCHTPKLILNSRKRIDYYTFYRCLRGILKLCKGNFSVKPLVHLGCSVPNYKYTGLKSSSALTSINVKKKNVHYRASLVDPLAYASLSLNNLSSFRN